MLGYSTTIGPKSEFYARKALSISVHRGWEFATWDASKYIGQCFWAQENFEYMSIALQRQKKQLTVIIFGMVLMVLLAAGILLLGRRLRASHKEQEETAVVMEETLADLQHSKGPADGIDAQVSDREKEILELLIKFDAANTA